MDIPERLWRHPKGEAREKLAARFDLPFDEGMQDWEWEVADCNRVEEFLAAYRVEQLCDDERFALMETIIQSVEDCFAIESFHWKNTQVILEEHIELHIYPVCYWACLDLEKDEMELTWHCAPAMRAILNRYRARFDFPPHDV